MSDPIKDILRKLDTEMAQAVAAGSGKGLGGYDEVIKQIRQQIGRELQKSRAFLQHDIVDFGQGMGGHTKIIKTKDVETMINEVCQLKETKQGD